ncbi:MAG: putative sugar nucleotidyl transferase [Gemmatimonadetes bacterium]|nr:putative sugar nucleotidyl transferase [Gemmatimonadota bacterium]
MAAPHRLFLFDDPVARGWHPFALTRPAGELLFGTETLRARSERVFAARCEGHFAGDALRGFEEPGAPPCLTGDEPGDNGHRLLLSSRFVPDEAPAEWPGGSVVVSAGGTPVGIRVPHGTALPGGIEAGRYPEAWPRVAVEGRVLASPWELMATNRERLRADGARFPGTALPAGVHRVGDGAISVAPGAVVEAGVVLDTTGGPVMVGTGAHVRAPGRICGPAWVGPGSTILGGELAGVSIGPECRVRGEVVSSLVLGHANKAHDGFLGHSIVGRWVNLGAMTSNSNLKNTYGPVRVQVDGRTVETGLMKAGCMLGDHVRTGIGTLLDTGTVVGAGSNLFGGRLPPKSVPPFAWGSGAGSGEYDIERFLDTAAVVMRRRGVTLAPGMRELYRRAFHDTAGLRAHPGG